MAKGKKTGGRDFKPGHHLGRPKTPPDIAAVKTATRELLAHTWAELEILPVPELKALAKDPATPVLARGIAKALVNFATHGTYGGTMEKLLERLLGKPPQPITGEADGPLTMEFILKREDKPRI